MMEGQKGSTLPVKTKGNGVKGKPPYSVETPYGFHLDLDFLKYVDDIEKGNMIRRIPIHRRNKGPRASTLPRHFTATGWGSTGALGSRQWEANSHGYPSWANGHRSHLSPTGLRTLSGMEARIREFDEQPLGEHIRPNLLRASSLPLTVLLRQSSESSDDPGCLRGSGDHLAGRNVSCEDVFLSPGSRPSQECSALLRRLREALERVRELEMEIRVIPELRAQICILQEERQRLRPGLPSSSLNGNTDTHTASHHDRNHNASQGDSTHEWRTSTDLDELLTVTSLQAKVAALEQKLHETDLELQRALAQPREQKEGREPDVKIEHLVRKPSTWVQAERVLIEQVGDQAVVRSAGEAAGRGATAGATVVHHIRRIKRLLEEQWECLCADIQLGNPKVKCLQQEMMGLVDIITSHYTQHSDNEELQPRDGPAWPSKQQHSGGDNNGKTVVGQHCVHQSEELESSISPGVLAAAQVEANGSRKEAHGQIRSGGAGPQRTDGGAKPEKADAPERTAKPKPHLSREQMEGSSVPGCPSRGRETVSSDFLAACQFLNDHMDNMDNPNNEMRKALIVLFQRWFSVAAEEGSAAGDLAAYLREVRKSTPTLLAFLVNLADDNGNTVLHYSVSHCNHSIVGLLLETGACDVNLQNNAGYTAVMLAALTAPDGPGGVEVVRKLMEMGNIHSRSKQTGQTALHLAVRHGRVVMVRLLLSYGADANIQDNQGTTALMFASERGHTHVARLLLERSRCDLSLADKRGRTALSIAMQGSHTDTATLLQAHAKVRAL